MNLPFTREQFFDLFVTHNGTLWPALIALWTASAGVSVIIGLILMAAGVVDPLEGSLVILAGSVLIVLGTGLSGISYRVPATALVLVAAGMGALFGISSLGGAGGNTGRSVWQLLLCAPYPLGWILGLVGGARALRTRRSDHA